MNERLATCPLTQQQVIDEYFLENRARILDLAAFLDRVDRARVLDAADDVRLDLLRQALQALCMDVPERVEMVQMIFSEPALELPGVHTLGEATQP